MTRDDFTPDTPVLAGRRDFLRLAMGAAATIATATTTLLSPWDALAAASKGVRRLALVNLNTGEDLEAPYWVNGRYDRRILKRIDILMRDHRTEQVHRIDPRVLDLAYLLQRTVRNRGHFDIISGYRSPATNLLKRMRGEWGVARQSLHMEGKAIDIRLPGCNLRTLWQAARALRVGGVGYYPESGFVHLDTGPVRYW